MDICMDFQEGIIKLPVYSSGTLYKGQGLKWGVEGSAEGTKALITVDAQADNQFAIMQETVTSCATNVQTPLIYQATVRLLNNPTLLKIYYDMSTSNDVSITAGSSTTVSATLSDYYDGSWLYINSGTGAGQLRYVKAASTSALTVNTAFTVTPDSTSDIIIIRYPGLQEASAGLSLDTTYYSMIATVLAESDTSLIIPIKNFVQGPMGIRELDITANPDLETDGLDSRGVRFFSICVNTDGLYATGI